MKTLHIARSGPFGLPRTARALLTACTPLAACALVSACTFGGWNAETIAAGRGAPAEIVGTGDGVAEWVGELLMADQEGVLLLFADRELLRVPWTAMDRIRLRNHPGSFRGHGRAPTEGQLRDVRLASRYPFGLTDAQFDELLAALGQAGVREVGESAPSAEEVDAFVQRTIEATRLFVDRNEAIRAGYRRLGADFPGMGEHWVHPSRIVRGAVDPARPPVLSYIVVDGTPVLTGVAFTLPLGPDDTPPTEPFGRHVWHDHSGDVDEETLLLNHPSSAHHAASGFRLSMVHVWTEVENPAGRLAQNNWTLPWLRVGLQAPDSVDEEAARGLSLADGGRVFYAQLIARATELTSEEREAVGRVIDRFAGRVEREMAAMWGPDGVATDGPDPRELRVVWREFWRAIEEVVRAETWAAVEELAGSGGGRHPVSSGSGASPAQRF